MTSSRFLPAFRCSGATSISFVSRSSLWALLLFGALFGGTTGCGADANSDEGNAADQVAEGDGADPDEADSDGSSSEGSGDPSGSDGSSEGSSSSSDSDGEATDPDPSEGSDDGASEEAETTIAVPDRGDPDPETSDPEPSDPDVAPTDPLPEPEPIDDPDPCAEVSACDLECSEGAEYAVDENGCVHTCDCIPIQDPEPDVTVEPCDALECELLCPEGTANPVDENGCISSCSCEPVLTPDPPLLCGMQGAFCLPQVVSVAIVAAPANCCEGFSCQQVCTNSEPPSCNYSCEPSGATKDPCGGCGAGTTCVFQNGGPGPSHYACAEALEPCNEDDACGCIEGQGTCSLSLDDGLCHCENGLD